MKKNLRPLTDIMTLEQAKEVDRICKECYSNPSKTYDAREVGIKRLKEIIEVENALQNTNVRSKDSRESFRNGK